MSGEGGSEVAERLGQCAAGAATRGAGDADAAGSGDGEDGDGGELAAAKMESGENALLFVCNALMFACACIVHIECSSLMGHATCI